MEQVGLSLRWVHNAGAPRRGLADEINEWRERNWPRLWRQALRMRAGLLLPRAAGLLSGWGQLSLRVLRADGDVLDLGLASLRVVTNAGVAALVDAMQGALEPETFRYHGIGTGTTAESVNDTALVAELTTQYSTDNTRATGTLEEGASANVFRTVGTNTVDAAVAITEHGVFNAAAVGSGVLLDRSVFAAVNLSAGDSLETTYDLTFPAGG